MGKPLYQVIKWNFDSAFTNGKGAIAVIAKDSSENMLKGRT